MDTVDLNAKLNVKTPIRSTPGSVPLNAKAAAACSMLLKARERDLPAALAPAAVLLANCLSTPDAGSAAQFKAQQAGSVPGELVKLTSLILKHDERLKQRLASLLSDGRQQVRPHEAADELIKLFEVLPPALQEGTAVGHALYLFILTALACLTDRENMGAGLERDLVGHGVSLPEAPLAKSKEDAAADTLQAALIFLKGNQPEALVQSAAAAAPEAAAADKDKEAAPAAPAAKDPAAPAEPKSSPVSEPEETPAYAGGEQMPERIRTLISKAAAAAKKGHLMGSEQPAAVHKKTAAAPAPQAAERTFQAKTKPAADVRQDASKLSLAELSARASRLQQQFRQERQRQAAEGRLPNPAPLPEKALTAQQVLKNTLSPKTPQAELREAAAKTAALQAKAAAAEVKSAKQATPAPVPEAAPQGRAAAKTAAEIKAAAPQLNETEPQLTAEEPSAPLPVKSRPQLDLTALLSASPSQLDAAAAQGAELLPRQTIERLKRQLAAEAALTEEIAKSKAELLRTQQEIIKLQTDVAKMQEQTLQAAKETAAAQLKLQLMQLEAQQLLSDQTSKLIAKQQEQTAEAPTLPAEQAPAEQPAPLAEPQSAGTAAFTPSDAAQAAADTAAQDSSALNAAPDPAAADALEKTAADDFELKAGASVEQSDRLLHLYDKALEKADSTALKPPFAAQPQPAAGKPNEPHAASPEDTPLKSPRDPLEAMLSALDNHQDRAAAAPSSQAASAGDTAPEQVKSDPAADLAAKSAAAAASAAAQPDRTDRAVQDFIKSASDSSVLSAADADTSAAADKTAEPAAHQEEPATTDAGAAAVAEVKTAEENQPAAEPLSSPAAALGTAIAAAATFLSRETDSTAAETSKPQPEPAAEAEAAACEDEPETKTAAPDTAATEAAEESSAPAAEESTAEAAQSAPAAAEAEAADNPKKQAEPAAEGTDAQASADNKSAPDTSSSAAADKAVQEAPSSTAEEAPEAVKQDIMQSLLSTVPGDDFKEDEHETLMDKADKKPEPAPSAAAKSGGFFQRLAAFFTGKSAAPAPAAAVNKYQSAPIQLHPSAPLHKTMADLSRLLQDPKLPDAVKSSGQAFLKALGQPLADLNAVNEWLNFITAPLASSSPQAAALQRFSLLLLTLRLKEQGKSVDELKAKYQSSDPELAKMLTKALQEGHAAPETVTALIDSALSQAARLHELTYAQESLTQFLGSYVPLPPNYAGGREGGFNLKQKHAADGREIWQLNFFFDLKDLGPIQLKAEAQLPEISLSIVTDNLEALLEVQSALPRLSAKLQNLGLTVRESSVRLGHVFMPTASFKAES